jgi:hypothetical protein
MPGVLVIKRLKTVVSAARDDARRCGGRMRLLAAIQPPDVTQAILACLELPSRAPPTAPAFSDPEEWAGDFEASL